MCNEEFVIPNGSLLYLSDGHGVYIPQAFEGLVNHDFVEGVTDEQWAVLHAGPNGEDYWDVWNAVENNAIVTDPLGPKSYTLHHDGDLWLILKESS